MSDRARGACCWAGASGLAEDREACLVYLLAALQNLERCLCVHLLLHGECVCYIACVSDAWRVCLSHRVLRFMWR